MDAEWLNGLIQNHISWLSNELKIDKINGQTYIHTPYLDVSNDRISIELSEMRDGQLVISDSGNTLTDLWLEGLSVKHGRRAELLNGILAGFGVKKEDDHLYLITTPDGFARDLLYFVQCVISVYDLVYTKEEVVVDIFSESVDRWLRERAESRGFDYQREVRVDGVSGDSVAMDFVVSQNGSRKYLKLMKDHPNSISSVFLAFSELKTENGNGESRRDKIGIWNDTGGRGVRRESNAKIHRVCTPVRWMNKEVELVPMLP